MKQTSKRYLSILVVLAMVLTAAAGFTAKPVQAAQNPADMTTEEIIAQMTPDEKISQMIIPAFEQWEGVNVTDLSAVPGLAEMLRRHQYGGAILYGANVKDTAQIATLLSQLQVNNAQIEGVSVSIPYFTSLDQEGGSVIRLNSGTRMNGNMSIGATGNRAMAYAEETGAIIGEEVSVLGFNMDFAPDIDVNNNAANPVIGIRSFSDEPNLVAALGTAFGQSLAKNNVIATYKHYPGHGDTTTDSHIGTPSVEKTLEQLEAVELVPFKTAIENGADQIMTAHITYPLVDEEQTFASGEKGYYPATMSKKMIQELLRNQMGYNGLVITDALRMDAIQKAKLVEGEAYSAEYGANIAEKVINAGVDILLAPLQMTKDVDAAAWYDEYIGRLVEKAENGSISMERINESVARILNAKKKYGVFNTDTTGETLPAVIAKAETVVGSEAHHAREKEIAQDAVTLLKNEGDVLPISAKGKKIVFVGRNDTDYGSINQGIAVLQKNGLMDADAEIVNLVTGTTSGKAGSGTKITIDYYYQTTPEPAVHITDALKAAVAEADVVICLSKTVNLSALLGTNPQYQAIRQLMDAAKAAKAKFVFLSDYLPYDAARYQEADAIVLCYLGTAMNLDPTDKSGSAAVAFNANVPAAVADLFGYGTISGKVPVNIPKLDVDAEGKVTVSSEVLYERGYGIVLDPKETPAAARFTDVSKDDWFYDDVNYVAEQGIMTGMIETVFGPTVDTSRAMIVTMLYRLEGEPEAGSAPFQDVAQGKWYDKAVAWAQANGIVTGYTPTTFGPADPVTREQIATILYRYAKYKGWDVSQVGDLSVFTDAGQVSDWAEDALVWANGAGIITGMNATTLNPQGNAARAQVAAMFHRFLTD